MWEAARLNSRVRYYRNPKNPGATPNFNKAFHLARSPFFKWAAHDDTHDLTYVRTCCSYPRCQSRRRARAQRDNIIDERGAPFRYDPLTQCCVDPYTGVHQRPDHPSIGDSTEPAQRFWQVLSRTRWGSHMFGLMRREALAQTKLLLNFAGSDRPMLAELALLGRFQSSPDALYQKQFHEGACWALNQAEPKGFLSTDGEDYSRRKRQLGAFFSSVRSKPVGMTTKATCGLMVAVHVAKVAAQALRRKEARNAAQGSVWRNKQTIGT